MCVQDPAIEMPALRMFRRLYQGYESEVLVCFRFVEPTEENLPRVHSLEFYQLHLKLCAAVDSLLHLWYTKKVEPKETDATDYFLLFGAPELDVDLTRTLILLANPKIVIKPFEGWTEKARPEWWKDHNITKHDLNSTTYLKGNLLNVITSLGALYLLLNDKGTRSTYPVATQVFQALF
jgi:hypothetical protein